MGKTIINNPQITIFIGGICLPFPVMGGKHGIVLPTFPNRCIQLLQIPGAKNASPHQELCRILLGLALFKRLTSETLRNIMSEYVHVCMYIYIYMYSMYSYIIVIYIYMYNYVRYVYTYTHTNSN